MFPLKRYAKHSGITSVMLCKKKTEQNIFTKTESKINIHLIFFNRCERSGEAEIWRRSKKLLRITSVLIEMLMSLDTPLTE